MRRKLLLFLLLTTVFFRTSWASNDTIKDSFNDATTISPDVEYDEHETTTLSLVNADLDDAENSSNSPSKSITTLPDVTTVTNDDSTQTQTESFASSGYTTEEPVNQETTLPSSSDNLKDEIDKNLPKNNEDEPNTSASKPTDKTELNMDEESLSRIPVEPLTESSNEPVEDGNNPSPDKISKRILISSAPESDMHPMNIDEFPEERLDSWRPLAAWSLPDENFASLSPTVRFPVDDSSNRDVHSPLQPSPGTQENFSVLKEPVTAYYFDLASVIPEQPSGPLHDPRIIRTRTHGHPSKINESPDILQGNLKSSFHDTNPPNQGSEDNVNSRFTSGIHPTPTLLRPVNTAEEIDLISNTEPEGASPPQTEDVTSSQNSEPTTIPSSHDTTATEFQKSTPAYTLGNSTDFHFTQGETNTVKNSTNTSSPDIMPSTLSSDQPLEIQNSTGDLRNKSKQSLTTASLFEIPIHSTDLPSPISLSTVYNTRSDINIKPTLMSRIPLWKRISQRKSLSDLSFSKNSASVTHTGTILSSVTSSTLSSIPFENDIPIGILSPGILKYPVHTANDNSIKQNSDTLKVKEDSDLLKETEFPLSNVPNTSFPHFTASPIIPFLDSSMHSSTFSDEEAKPHTTPISIPNIPTNNNVETHLNNTKENFPNISPSIVHNSLSSINKLGNTDITETEDDKILTHDHETKTNVDISSTSTLRIAADNSSLHMEGEFTPLFTSTPLANDNFTLESDKNSKVAHTDDFSHIAPTQPIIDLPLKNASKIVNSHSFVNPSENPAHLHPLLNEINSSSVEDKTEIKSNENTKNFEESKVEIPPLFHNSTTLSESFDNFTEKSTNNEHLHRNDSFEVPQPTNETRSSPSNLDEKRAVTLTNASSTPERIENDTTIYDSEDSDNVHTDVTDLSGVEELAPKTTDHSSEHSSTTAPTSTMAELPPSEVNTTAKAKTSPSSPPVSTPKPTSVEYIPDNLEINIPADPQNTTSSDALPSPVENINEEDNDDKVMIDVITEDVPGSEPLLHLVQMHANGTNSTDRIPFLKAEVFYNTQQYCKHQQNVENLLEESINLHLRNSSNDSVYEIEVFMPPDCKNIYEYNNSSNDSENITYVYFYVKQNGKISPQSTRSFPINPFELEISQELAYLKEKLGSLELQETSPLSPPIEEADSASLVVVVIVTSIVILLLIGGILACFMVKRRRSAEKEGRRCTPAANDAYSLDSVSVFYHSLRRKSKKRASNKSLKSYLNQGFDDPNLPSRPLSFAKLTLFITDNEAIYDEFSNIPSVNPKYDEMPRGVEDKNRYANVIPISETRILLGGSKTTPCAEYINANSIHGPKGELRYYIATQAPLDNTVSDFWQMVWEQESKIIVMLTDFVEKGIDKCADYLPPSETLDCHRVYGEFQITLKSRDMRENYIMSLLQIKNLENNLVREIAHMWYTGWPHSGVPNEEKLFISFIFDVRTTRKQLRAKGPIIVHCSPGTGRTGTYITCDLCMRQFDDQKIVDIPKTVFRIRRERAGAVQTKEQYAFIYRVVNLYAAKLTTGNLDSF